jgi:NAD(P)H-flavin reductase/ferredoxin
MQLSYQGKKFTCQADETVLEALLRQNSAIPNSCRRQICLSCLMCSLRGPPPTASQQGLNDTLKLQNYFLACACKPEQDMEISLPQEAVAMELPVTVTEAHHLQPGLLSISLQCTDIILNYKGGQSVILFNNDHIGAQCPIVSPANSRLTGKIVIHLDLSNTECFTKWAVENLRAGILMSLYGPIGRMVYKFNDVNQAVLLVAKNGGLSALIGILQDIFAQEHRGAIYLLHEVDYQAQLYLSNELNEISRYFPNFQYLSCIQELSENAVPKGLASQLIRQTVPDLTNWQVFICGPRDFANAVQKQAYLAGGNMRNIFVDITK